MIAGEATRIVPGAMLDRRLTLIELKFSKSELSNRVFTLTHLQNQKQIGGRLVSSPTQDHQQRMHRKRYANSYPISDNQVSG